MRAAAHAWSAKPTRTPLRSALSRPRAPPQQRACTSAAMDGSAPVKQVQLAAQHFCLDQADARVAQVAAHLPWYGTAYYKSIRSRLSATLACAPGCERGAAPVPRSLTPLPAAGAPHHSIYGAPRPPRRAPFKVRPHPLAARRAALLRHQRHHRGRADLPAGGRPLRGSLQVRRRRERAPCGREKAQIRRFHELTC